MIVADTSIWIDHFRNGHSPVERVLDAGSVMSHPWVVGELALGQLGQRREILDLLRGLPQAVVATADEVLTFVERHTLYGRGIGYMDAQLLAATQLTSGARLWTHDKQLAAAASSLGLVVDPAAVGK